MGIERPEHATVAVLDDVARARTTKVSPVCSGSVPLCARSKVNSPVVVLYEETVHVRIGGNPLLASPMTMTVSPV